MNLPLIECKCNGLRGVIVKRSFDIIQRRLLRRSLRELNFSSIKCFGEVHSLSISPHVACMYGNRD